MKKCTITFAAILLLMSFSVVPETHNLTIKIEGIKELKGNLGILLFNTAEGYPESAGKALKSYTVKVDSKSMSINLGDFPPGE